MGKICQQLMEWGKELKTFRLSRWERFSNLEFCMDRVKMSVNRYLPPVVQGEKHPLLTSSMVSNYVKLDLIPAPAKKKYNKEYVAFLLAITTLRQILAVPGIKEGILLQGKTIGIREIHNLFCDEQGAAVWMVSQLA